VASVTIKAYRGIGMEGAMARWYERTTGRDMEQFRSLARRLAEIVPAGDVLEVAPGPGFLAIELARLGKHGVTAVDASKTFVDIGRRNAAEAGLRIEFLEGNAAKLPFPDASFDLFVCRAAFKNFAEPQKALGEMYRVLRPGATGLIIDLLRDTPMAEIERYVAGSGAGAASRWFMRFVFRFMLLKRAYTRAQLESMLAPIPFRSKEVRPMDLGAEVWVRK
jgi:ubiquinone/menaquinone biosynthesis C-methylase UbiE